MASVSQAVQVDEEGFGPRRVTVMCAFRCDYCRRLLVGYCNTEAQNVEHVSTSEWLDSVDGLLSWQPQRGVVVTFSDVPEPIAAAAAEVHACLSIGAAQASVALARAIVESIAKDKGITAGSLQQKIDRLHADGHITDQVRASAHEVRLDGNQIAHGDLLAEAVTIEDAEDLVAMLDEVLHSAYQSPARVRRVQTRRDARRGRAAPGS